MDIIAEVEKFAKMGETWYNMRQKKPGTDPVEVRS